MLNIIWLGMMVIAVICGAINGRIPEVVASVTDSAELAITLAIGLAGIMIFWLGLLRIAEEGGLINGIAKILRPMMRWLFPEVPSNHPAERAIIMNMSANMLGLNNAATPFGLKAMHHLNTLNPHPGTASNAMCTFLAINTSSIQLIQVSAIAYLSAAGATQPTFIIGTTILATLCSTIAAVIAVKWFERWQVFRLQAITTPPTSQNDHLSAQQTGKP